MEWYILNKEISLLFAQIYQVNENIIRKEIPQVTQTALVCSLIAIKIDIVVNVNPKKIKYRITPM